MCGIVGYAGKSNGVIPVLEGLSRLEYRGYDSSGISTKVENDLSVYKKEGKLENLRTHIKDLNLTSNLCIGHTRWATHGAVNDTNAHPHGNEIFSIVHNGIIENANILREDLKSKGYNFNSETDTEVFLWSITDLYKKTNDIEKSIIETFKKVDGNSAFVIMNKENNKMYSIKRSAPLVCGLNSNSNETYMSSDPYALVGFADKIYFPEDGILCIADYTSLTNVLKFKNLDGSTSKDYKVQDNTMEMESVTKGGYDHFMLKEIFEQPGLIRKLTQLYLSDDGVKDLNNFEKFSSKNYIHLAACGTALHAGYVIKNFIERETKIKVGTDFASEFRYRKPNISKDDLGLFISQSGETADTLACQQMCKDEQLYTLSIVNVNGSTLFRECDKNLLIHAGVEIGVASTKAFTQQVLVGLLLSKALASNIDKDVLLKEFNTLASRVEDVLSRKDEIKNIARAIYNKKGFIFTGRGEQYPIALEGALKLKEIAYVHAEGYAAGELKHGPISLIDEDMVNVAIITPDLYDKTYSNAQEVKARKGILVSVGEVNNKELENDSDYYFGIDFDGLVHTKPVITNVVLQLLSYHIAKIKGTDIDKPRNLAKSVTVE
ncbi:MAG: glutamine--fructose-6-phosphate transaminase (isomerizing) [Bacteriovoracaceae bacterium]|jgi:glucosamine--fructose-6-phosphate aminotransferase (isomerizing)|nr:glutamine--fructose-6-phosphate transaminase (isomerizing) [Bacteriovoracaceae bacterium]